MSANTAASQCEGKVKFATFESAKRNGASSRRLREAGVRVYHCLTCRHFHVASVALKKPAKPAGAIREEPYRYDGEYDRRRR